MYIGVMDFLDSQARNLAEAMIQWPPERLDKLEACREAARNVCLVLGVTEDTDCLCRLFVLITKSQVMLNGFPGDDIDKQCIGVPGDLYRGLDYLKSLNVYEVRAIKMDVEMLQAMMKDVEIFNPPLIWEIRVLIDDMLATL